MSVDEALCWLTRRRHHFKILLRYTPDPNNGQLNVTRLQVAQLIDRQCIADERLIKKLAVGNMIDQLPRRLKRNGQLEIAEVYYLGWFKPLQQ